MRLVAATYNIHGCIGVDRRADHARIVRVLRGLAADVIALQEVDSYHHQGTWRGHLDYFAEQTGLRAVAGPTLTRATGDYGNGILTRLDVRSTRRIEIGVPGREPRAVLEVVLVGPKGPLRIVATHLGLGAEERRVQSATICDLVRESAEMPVVVMGDFNEWLSFAGSLREIERAMGRGRAVPSFPSVFPILALDRIWVRPAGALLTIGAVRRGEARYASDHLPVRAVVQL